MKRSIKQLIIIITVLVVMGGLFFAFKWLMRIEPTCFDGLQNGAEEGVDCGSVCNKNCPPKAPKAVPLTIKEIHVIHGNNRCDVIAIIQNPNSSLGAKKVPFNLTWGEIKNKGEFYIYPNEERYLAEINLACQAGGNPEFSVGDPEKWEYFKSYEKPNLEISDYKLSYPEGSYEFAELKGMVSNRSPFDLKTIEIYVFIKDLDGQYLASNHTTINSMLVGERREFRVFWTNPFPQRGSAVFFATSNLFTNQNFLQRTEAESTKWK